MHLKPYNSEMVNNVELILSTLRHELGNSINSIKVTLDVLQQNYDLFDDEKKKNYLKRGSEAVAKQQKFIEAMKSYAKFNANIQQEIAFLDFWDRFIKNTENILRQKDIEFHHYHDLKPCFVTTNEIALHQAIDNILDNAIDALQNKENSLIEVKALDRDIRIELMIKDNGPGIKENDMPKIFTPFFSTKPTKMGMGLPITLKLLSKMNASIEVESVLNQGTEARLWLDRVIDHPQ